MSWMSSDGWSSRATISRYLASESCPWPRSALAVVRISWGRRTGASGTYRSLAMARSKRVNAGGVDGMHRVDAREGRWE